MKRFLAFVIAMMMLVQTGSSLAEAVTDGTYEAVSEPVGLSMYHIVTFTADGEDVSTIFVVDGAKMESLPEAPVVEGKEFIGWETEDGSLAEYLIIEQDRRNVYLSFLCPLLFDHTVKATYRVSLHAAHRSAPVKDHYQLRKSLLHVFYLLSH